MLESALTFAKEVYPELDIQAYSHKLDALAQKVRLLARGTSDPEQRIRALNTVLFRHEGFRYDRDPFARALQGYYYLNGILDTKKGICYTMPLLYVAVAQRLGYPIYPVSAPDHLFVRYVDPSFKEQNVETTSGGKYFADEEYIKRFSVNDRALKAGGYMKTMTYREFLGHMLYTSTFAIRKDGEKALAYVEQANELHPAFADFHMSLSQGYLLKSRIANATLAPRLLSKSQYHARKANVQANPVSHTLAV
jgi:regulator of sirC expression with transglutaminase-like and TPR domain